MFYWIFLLLPISAFAFYDISDKEPCTIHAEGKYFVIETIHHRFYVEMIQHDPECECEWSQGENVYIEYLR